MPAILLLHRKRLYDDGAVAEVKLWLVPRAVRGSLHRFKYSIFYGRKGVRVIGYDNEAGKGDHRHYGECEEAYVFTTAEQLIADFTDDLRAARRNEGRGLGTWLT